jgi:hypothetical protein
VGELPAAKVKIPSVRDDHLGMSRRQRTLLQVLVPTLVVVVLIALAGMSARTTKHDGAPARDDAAAQTSGARNSNSTDAR